MTTAVALAHVSPALAENDENLFYFYSPDWRPADLGALTESVQQAAEDVQLPLTFQAFTRYDDFIERIGQRQPTFLWAPAWLDQEAGPFAFELVALARPQRNGRATYRKGLMSRPGIDQIEDLRDCSIAATALAMGANGDQRILDAFDLDPASTRVVAVQKDIDALLALSFGQVDAALVTSSQFEHHSRTNPGIVKDFQIIALSPEIQFPAVYATPLASADARKKLTRLLQGLNDSDSGRQLLELLDYGSIEAAR